MAPKYFHLLLGIVLCVITLGACTTSESDCISDSDCQAGYYCESSSGGVLFGGGLCMLKDKSPHEDPFDATNNLDVSDASNLEDSNPSNDVENSDSNDHDDTADSPESPGEDECVIDDDCMPNEEGDWTSCDGFKDSCATNGKQTKQVRTSSCVNGFCAVKTTAEQRDCERDTAGQSCGTASESAWGECSFDGFKSRELSTHLCGNGECSVVTTTESLACSCATNESCGPVTKGAFGPCIFENTCDSTGKKERDVRTPTCNNTSCSIVITAETESCSRQSTNGKSCGTPTVAAWSACTNSNSCATSGIRTQQTHAPVCQDDACGIVTTTDSQACALTPASTCGTVSFSNWTECSFSSTCASAGTKARTKTTPTCQNQNCNSVQVTESDTCTRTLPTGSCGAVTESGWGACQFANACTSTGTQSQTVTTPTCQNQSCNAVVTTPTRSCTRTLPTGSCGAVTESGWGACQFANACADTGTQSQTVTTPTCQNQSCNAVVTTPTRSCSRTLPTGSCGTVTYSSWSTCQFDSICTNSGTQTRTVTTPTCQNKTCTSVVTTATQSCGARNTNDTACGSPTNPPWGQCLYFQDCSSSGTAKRTVQTPICQAGTCSGVRSVPETNYAICERNTNGESCTARAPGGQMTLGTCYNECCDAPCPPGKTCLQCALE